jgi:hypothetical protein
MIYIHAEPSPYLTGNTYRRDVETNRLMLFGETVAVCCENRTEHTNALCGDNVLSFNVLKPVVYAESLD